MYYLMVATPLQKDDDKIGVVAENLETCQSVIHGRQEGGADTLVFYTRRTLIQADYLFIMGLPDAMLCSQRFLHVLEEMGVVYKRYPARLMYGKKKQGGQDMFVLVPQKVGGVIDWEKSEVYWIDEYQKHLTKLALQPLKVTTDLLLFYPEELINRYLIHSTVKARLEAAQLHGVGFAPLDAVVNPLTGVERVAIEKQLQANPQDTALLLRLSILYSSTFRLQDALNVLQRVIVLDPTNHDALHSCGSLLRV